MSLLKIYMEATAYDVKEHQKYLEKKDDKYHEQTPIDIPKGFTWISLAGGFFAYEKELKNGTVVRLAGGEGNRKLRVYEKDEHNKENENIAMLFKDREHADDSSASNPTKVEYFYNEKELKTILNKWDK